jgi:hypothetical protein
MTDQTIRDRAAQVIGDAHAAWCKDDYPRELYAEDAILAALDTAGIGLYDTTTHSTVRYHDHDHQWDELKDDRL